MRACIQAIIIIFYMVKIIEVIWANSIVFVLKFANSVHNYTRTT